MRAILALLVGASLSAIAQADTSRVVSGAGAITETICALGARDQLVAVDSRASFLRKFRSSRKSGIYGSWRPKGFSVHPTLLLVTDDAGPPGVWRKLRRRGKGRPVTNGHTPEAAEERIRAIGDELGKATEAGLLIAGMRKEVTRLACAPESSGSRPKVLFICRGGG
jgi:iron complex transport system substrate-binding protein